MINGEVDFLVDDSSEYPVHANIPRVLVSHCAPNNLSIIKKHCLTQSLKLPKNNFFKETISKKNKENEINKNINKTKFYKPKINNNKNNDEISEKVIELDENISKNNFIVYTSTYKRFILKTNNNENKNKIENKRSLLLKHKKLLLNKSYNKTTSNQDIKNKDPKKDFNLSVGKVEKNKLKINNKEEKKISSLKSKIISKDKSMNTKGKILEKKKTEFLSGDKSKDNINSKKLELNQKLNNNKINNKNNNHSLIKRSKTNIEQEKKIKILMKSKSFKSENILKEKKRQKFLYIPKAFSLSFDCFKQNTNKTKEIKINNIKNNKNINKKYMINKKPVKLPLVQKNNKKDENIIINININNNIINVEENKNFIGKSVIIKNNNNLKVEKNKEKVNILKSVKIDNKDKNNILKDESIHSIKSQFVLTKQGKDEFGHVKINQDSYILLKELNGLKDFNIFGVLDGHGSDGHFVSQFAARYIQMEIQINKSINKLKDTELIYQKLSSNNFQIIKNIFEYTDIKLQDQEIESRNSGTTCVIVIQIGRHIICANVGDSRAILVYDKNKDHNYQILPLSIDCKPDLKEERERINRKGGIVEKSKNQFGVEMGPWRVWAKNREYPGLAMSRAIGDFNGKDIGIISEPKIIETDFSINICYIVICSDGVWEFLDNEDMMKFGNEYYEKNNPGGYCKEVVNFSIKCWESEGRVMDDITMITIFY